MRAIRDTRTYRTALSGLLTAVMLAAGYLESLLPPIGIPGVKLGLSNGVLIFAVYLLDIPTAFILMALKVSLSGLLFSGVSAMAYAFTGGLMSLTAMSLGRAAFGWKPLTVSVLGGVAHNIGQICAAILIARLPGQIVYYLLLLIVLGAACGFATGVCSSAVMARYLKIGGDPGRTAPKRKSGAALMIIAAAAVLAVAFFSVRTLIRPAAAVLPPEENGTIRLLTNDDLMKQLPPSPP